MAPPNERLANALAALAALQVDGRRVLQSRELSRADRERLVQSGFLQEVAKGWLISTGPHVREGDTTPWFATFWEFCARYCGERFGKDWHLSPEQSLLLHGEATAVPTHVVVVSPAASNHKLSLPFGTSLYDLKAKQMPPREDLTMRDGLRLFSLPAALARVPESFYARAPIETQVALTSLGDTAPLLRRLLEGGHSAIAGRLAGALRGLQRPRDADDILSAMRAAGFEVRESSPFDDAPKLQSSRAASAPIIGRINLIWDKLRDDVLADFPAAPGAVNDRFAYLKRVEETYKQDAYHSLSIEGYSVTPELIDRVRSGGWNPDENEEDKKNRDALAARGYWQAFQLVKKTIAEILVGGDAGALVGEAQRAWYRELFQPSVGAGLIRAAALAGYRDRPVFLRGSRHVPPRAETVADAMNALFQRLQNETEPSVRAVLGHWLFGYIHPYPDGNGRTGRFIMNALLASGGYPWTIIRLDDRTRYLESLEAASVDMDIRPFTKLLAERVEATMKEAS